MEVEDRHYLLASIGLYGVLVTLVVLATLRHFIFDDAPLSVSVLQLPVGLLR